jgi:c-di-GMP-binding flagellar brake protein YcgR
MATTADNLGMLREAIARNAGMVLSLPSSEGQLRHHKSRFLADAGDGFWVQSDPEARSLVEELISTQRPAGVSFRSGVNKVIFATQIQHCMPDYELSAPVDEGNGTRIEALLLRFPDDVHAVQRRKSFRVPVTPGSTDLQVKVWTMTEQANLRDKPPVSREILCEVRDLSVGGIGLTIRATSGRLPNVATGDRIRIQLTLRGTVAVLEGRLRYPPRVTKDSSVRAGVQFKALGDSREDHHAGTQLNKIVNELQRELIRRKKLGIG